MTSTEEVTVYMPHDFWNIKKIHVEQHITRPKDQGQTRQDRTPSGTEEEEQCSPWSSAPKMGWDRMEWSAACLTQNSSSATHGEPEVMYISLNPSDHSPRPALSLLVEYSQFLTWAFNHDVYRPVDTAPQNLQPPPQELPPPPPCVPWGSEFCPFSVTAESSSSFLVARSLPWSEIFHLRVSTRMAEWSFLLS